jgi:hypothetical protein
MAFAFAICSLFTFKTSALSAWNFHHHLITPLRISHKNNINIITQLIIITIIRLHAEVLMCKLNWVMVVVVLDVVGMVVETVVEVVLIVEVIVEAFIRLPTPVMLTIHSPLPLSIIPAAFNHSTFLPVGELGNVLDCNFL